VKKSSFVEELKFSDRLINPICGAFEVPFRVVSLRQQLGRLHGANIVGQMERSRFSDSESVDLIESALADGKESPFDRCLHSQRSDFLTTAIETLSKREQIVILLYYREELSMREVGETMDLAESRVSQIHAAAVRKLRKVFEEMQLQEDSFR
jgi:RNA polymerase sigma factor FliA